MKKFLLLYSFLLMLASGPRVAFGKCDAILSYVRYPSLLTGWFAFGDSIIISIEPEDSVTLIYDGGTNPICYACYTIWRRGEDWSNSVIIKNGADSLNFHSADEGTYFVYKGTCNAPWFRFRITSSAVMSNLDVPASLVLFSTVSSNLPAHNLQYTIITPLGKIMEQGTCSGKIILRGAKPQNPLPSGIYFVIYYDALDNRQVLADKALVTNN